MSVTVSTIRDAIETRLATISGLEVRSHVPEMPTTPMAVCWPTRSQFDEAMARGMDRYDFSIAVLIDRADSETAQAKLDGYLDSSGSTSIKAAVEGGTPARTLGATVTACRLTGCTDIAIVQYGEVQFLFAEFDLEIHS